MTRILILSSSQDGHVIPVKKHLEEMNTKVDVVRFEEFENYTLTHSIGNTKRLSTFTQGEKRLNFDSYSSIWHRRPGRFPSTQFPEPWISNMVEQETRESVTGILNSIPCLWVNKPFNDLRCGKKLLQLESAVRVGLEVPKTLVTNEPDRVTEFFEECNGSVVYKLIGETTGAAVPASEFSGLPTLPLRETDLPFLQQVRYAPHLFQQRVEKTYDVRITIVGKKFFAGRIHSQSGRGTLDWRHDYSVKMESMKLPDEIERKCIELMQAFGLNYGAIDFCQTPDDRYVFIELNSAGQFYWLEQRTDLRISAEMAKLLALESEPMCS